MRTPHSNVHQLFPEIETIYRAYQVLLLMVREPAREAVKLEPAANVELGIRRCRCESVVTAYWVSRNSPRKLAVESSPTQTSNCSGSTTHFLSVGLQYCNSSGPRRK